MSNADISIRVQVLFCIPAFISPGHMPTSRIAGLYDDSMCNCQALSKVVASLHAHQQYIGADGVGFGF